MVTCGMAKITIATFTGDDANTPVCKNPATAGPTTDLALVPNTAKTG